MDALKRFKWTVEIEVSETWVADGFNLTDNRANDIVQRALPYATGSEVSARVLKAPSPESIAIAQGDYKRLGWVRFVGGAWHVLAKFRGGLHGIDKTLCGLSRGDPNSVITPGSSKPGKVLCTECQRRDDS